VIEAYVEVGVALATDSGVAAWSYAPSLWGRCGQGPDEATALAALTDRPTVVVERVVGDEQAFSADFRPATPAQRDATLAVLARARAETLALVAGTPDEVLDRDDPDRVLPAFASWRTLPPNSSPCTPSPPDPTRRRGVMMTAYIRSCP
jgi:hypothetical protein